MEDITAPETVSTTSNDDPNTPEVETQTPDTPGKDENADGLTGGQTTADNFGDVLGV